jgi:hypothetical protein
MNEFTNSDRMQFFHEWKWTDMLYDISHYEQRETGDMQESYAWNCLNQLRPQLWPMFSDIIGIK